MAGTAVARYAVATYGDWPALVSAAEDVAALPDLDFRPSVMSASPGFSALSLPALTGLAHPGVRRALTETREILFAPGKPALVCSAGEIAAGLAQRRKQGCSGLADALGHWMVWKQAARFDEDIGRGRLILWTRLLPVGQEQEVCRALLKTSTDRVEVHDLVPV